MEKLFEKRKNTFNNYEVLTIKLMKINIGLIKNWQALNLQNRWKTVKTPESLNIDWTEQNVYDPLFSLKTP